MKKLSLACLAALAALVTGCPHNDYTVELTPRGQVVARRLDFYRADGVESNGVPKYDNFPTNELAAITALYTTGAVTRQGERHSASGEFSGALPGDVGGAGEYHYFATSLGDAGFYAERFRGNDDLTASATARLAAADQLTGLVLGWSRAEFGREPGYKNLRRFLDTDFRRDLKNLGMYFWAGEIAASGSTNATAEFIVRFGQYLIERRCLKIEDAPGLVQIFAGSGDPPALVPVQKFLAEKLGVPPAGPMPKSLALLADSAALEKSWEKFLTGTKAYRARLRQWEKDKKTRPDLQKPGPSEVVGEWFATLIESGSSSEDDHLTVRLTLAAAPDHTNGKWDTARRQVVWEANLEAGESARRLPVFCYANWSRPDEAFQQKHFGRMILAGDELLKYCLWQGGLEKQRVAEWEKFLSGLQPGEALDKTLEGFRLADNSSAADMGKDMLKTALQQKTGK